MNDLTSFFREFDPQRIMGNDETWRAFLTGKTARTVLPEPISQPGGGGKFTPDGAVLPFPGNTFLCHIDRHSPVHAAITTFQRRLMELPSARYYTPLPPDSFHMTVFCGISGGPPGTDGWPDGIAPDTPLPEIDALYLERLAGLRLPRSFHVAVTGPNHGHTLHIEPCDRASHDALWECRDRLRELTGLHRPDHDQYDFHISLAYLTHFMPDDVATQHLNDIAAIFDDHREALSDIRLGPVEFCKFKDMKHLKPRMLITERETD